MGILFVARDADVAPLCSDPSFSYFLVSGSVLPSLERLSDATTPAGRIDADCRDPLQRKLWFDARPETRAMSATNTRRQAINCPLALPGEASQEESGDCNSKHDVVPPCLVKNLPRAGGLEALNAENSESVDSVPGVDNTSPLSQGEGSRFEHPDDHLATNTRSLRSYGVEPVLFGLEQARVEQQKPCTMLRPGHALDPFLPRSSQRYEREVNAASGAQRDDPSIFHDYGVQEHVKFDGVQATALPWRLNAREPVSIGRVHRRVLKDMEMEEPMRDLEEKIALLRRTEV